LADKRADGRVEDRQAGGLADWRTGGRAGRRTGGRAAEWTGWLWLFPSAPWTFSQFSTYYYNQTKSLIASSINRDRAAPELGASRSTQNTPMGTGNNLHTRRVRFCECSSFFQAAAAGFQILLGGQGLAERFSGFKRAWLISWRGCRRGIWAMIPRVCFLWRRRRTRPSSQRA
jgi:hypothetical protein